MGMAVSKVLATVTSGVAPAGEEVMLVFTLLVFTLLLKSLIF